jgi:aminopeptidase YwaD
MRLPFYLALLFITVHGFTQDLAFYKSQVDTLCSETMYGRGYLNNGHKIAADYIQSEFEKFDLKVIQQGFPMTVNTFPEVSTVIINDSLKLLVGKDFIPSPVCGSISGTFNLLELDSLFITSENKKNSFLQLDLSHTVLIYHQKLDEQINALSQPIRSKIRTAKGIIILKPTALLGSFYDAAATIGMLDFLASSWPMNAKKITLNIQNKVLKVTSQNVIATSKKIDKRLPTLFIIGHYDHLGGYGKNCFVSGANDNASGIAMILDMAKHFKEKPIAANLIFMACGGEEAGLLGSSFFTEHPTFPLKKIDLVINLDLMGAGSEGIMVQNGSEHLDVYEAFVKENELQHLVPKIKKRGNSANSDHYPFTQKDVKAVFIYSLGDVGGYHNILDSKNELEYHSYEALFKLMVGTIEHQLVK